MPRTTWQSGPEPAQSGPEPAQEKPPKLSWRSNHTDNHTDSESIFSKPLSIAREEMERQHSCRSLPFTVLLWVVFCATQMGHRQVAPQHAMQLALDGVLRSSVSVASPQAAADAAAAVENATNATARRLLASSASNAITGANFAASKALGSVSTLEGILDWVGQTFLPQFWAGGPQGRGLLQEFNRAVGGVRLVSARLGGGSCPGSTALNQAYNLSCYSNVLEGTESGGLAASLRLPGMSTDSAGLQAFWLDLAQDEATVQAEVQQLRDGGWLTPGTRSVSVQAVVLNAHVSLLAFAEVRFELDRAGRITTLAAVRTLPTEVYGGDWRVVCGDVVLLLLLVYLAGAETIRLCRACCRMSPRTALSPVRALNWIVVVYGLGFSAFFGYLAYRLELLSTNLGRIPRPPEQAATLGSGDPGWAERHAALDGVFAEVIRLAGLLRACETNTFWYSLFLLLKFFEAFDGSPRLAAITATLRGCFVDLSHLLVVFIVVFGNFAVGGYFLFGQRLKEWSSVTVSFATSFRTLMGDFDFQPMFLISPISSLTWFWLFMIMIVLVMLNMLLAIVLDAYSEVKEKSQDQVTIWEQAGSIGREVAASWARSRASKVEAFAADGSDAEQAEEGNAGTLKVHRVTFSDVETSLPHAISDTPWPPPLGPLTPGDPLAAAAAPAVRHSSRQGSKRLGSKGSKRSQGEQQELSCWESLSEELEEVKDLGARFRQLEYAVWRCFWLEASSKGHSTKSLVRILTKAMAVPDLKLPPPDM